MRLQQREKLNGHDNGHPQCSWGDLSLENVILTRIVRVSAASWQPELWVERQSVPSKVESLSSSSWISLSLSGSSPTWLYNGIWSSGDHHTFPRSRVVTVESRCFVQFPERVYLSMCIFPCVCFCFYIFLCIIRRFRDTKKTFLSSWASQRGPTLVNPGRIFVTYCPEHTVTVSIFELSTQKRPPYLTLGNYLVTHDRSLTRSEAKWISCYNFIGLLATLV